MRLLLRKSYRIFNFFLSILFANEAFLSSNFTLIFALLIKFVVNILRTITFFYQIALKTIYLANYLLGLQKKISPKSIKLLNYFIMIDSLK